MRQFQFAIIAKNAFTVFSISVASQHELLEFAFTVNVVIIACLKYNESFRNSIFVT